MAARSINTHLWSDPFIEELSAHEILVFIYLFSCEEANVCGLFQCSPRRIEMLTKVSSAECMSALLRFEESEKLVYDSGLVFVRQMSKHQHAESLGYFHEHVIKMERDYRKQGNRAYEAFYDRFEALITTLPVKKKATRKQRFSKRA